MEKVWCGAKHQVMKGANTVFAQDNNSNAILYTRADVLRKDETKEVQKFVEYWKTVKGKVKETLVFDCKFTNYQILDDLNTEEINYITLRKRNKKLIKKITKNLRYFQPTHGFHKRMIVNFTSRDLQLGT